MYTNDFEPVDFGRSTPKTPDNTYEAIPLDLIRTPTLQQRNPTVSKPQDPDYDDVVQAKLAATASSQDAPPPLPAKPEQYYESMKTHSPPAKPLPYKPPISAEEGGPPAVPPRNEKSQKPEVTYASLTRRTKPQDLEYDMIPADAGLTADTDQQEEEVTSPPPPLPLKTEEYYESLDTDVATVTSPTTSSSKLQYLDHDMTPADAGHTVGLNTVATTKPDTAPLTPTESPTGIRVYGSQCCHCSQLIHFQSSRFRVRYHTS